MAGDNGSKLTGLRTPSIGYKPFRYPWAYEFWRRQQQVHWMPEEVPLGEDVKDWASKLTEEEKNLLTQIFRFFTQADVEVNDNYMERYARVFKPTEIKMMLASFSNIETVHIAAYALLLETIGMPETEFQAFMEYGALRDKHDYMALGVDEEAVFADYDFTNQAVDLEARMPRIQARMEERLGRTLDSAALRPMLGVHVDYLRQALDVIDDKYGSALNYMEQELGVGEAERAALKQKLSA